MTVCCRCSFHSWTCAMTLYFAWTDNGNYKCQTNMSFWLERVSISRDTGLIVSCLTSWIQHHHWYSTWPLAFNALLLFFFLTPVVYLTIQSTITRQSWVVGETKSNDSVMSIGYGWVSRPGCTRYSSLTSIHWQLRTSFPCQHIPILSSLGNGIQFNSL